jgi:hypothetical protein
MRRTFLLVMALAIMGGLMAGPAQAVPGNDAFSAAEVITFLPHSDDIVTTGATTEPGEPGPSCAVGTVFGATVWFKFEPDQDVHMKANTFLSSFNTLMALYQGTSLANLNELACNNNVAGNKGSRVTHILQGGQTYYFQVGGTQVATGTLKFRAKVRNWKAGITSGNDWLLDDCPPVCNGAAETQFEYGVSSDWKLAGYFVPHGVSTPWVRRGNLWLLNDWFDTTFFKQFTYGNASDWPLAGDWDGDGTVTPGVRRGNVWYLNNGLDSNPDVIFAYGSATDYPLVGDWNGDGIWTIGVRKGNIWFLNNANDPTADIPAFGYGSATDKPVVGDWDGVGDGKAGTFTPGVVKGNVWYLNNDFNPSHDITPFAYGTASHKPIVGDWDGIVE